MKKIPKKNYYILALLMIATIVFTIFIFNVYRDNKTISEFYNYSNKITSKEFDEYLTENPDVIIYISDKYDLTHEEFEKDFQRKITKLNLKNNLIYLDKSSLNKNFLKKLKQEYELDINKKKMPVIIVVLDKKIINVVYVGQASNVETIIQYEDFE